MTTFTATSQAASVTGFASGSFTSDGTAGTINIGFTAREVNVVNETDTIIWRKMDGQAAANCVKTVAVGTTTVDTGSAILINTDRTITLSATLCGTAKAIAWQARG